MRIAEAPCKLTTPYGNICTCTASFSWLQRWARQRARLTSLRRLLRPPPSCLNICM